MSGARTLPTAAEVEEQILRSPYHRWLGLRVVELDADRIVLEATAREEWANADGADVVHGGILAGLLDLAADWALVGALGTGVPTIDLTVNYLRAASLGTLRITGRVIRPGRQVSVAEAEIHDAGGRLIAVGRGSFLSAVVAPR
ncbi:uncharacterized protein (TIGR00369 family) [Georgenia soli]|uniref:Uncharacterized protein (TIGR00369 family) n=1 Tax=Georgenia soli TaxID=638953 RepID=A0A2A9EL28_9MICO|nr:PaaI family thioesterase [Georgenia soli]PFG39664.1 uncharacterized protein (TIGR00369 family) [Georgenia soli]